MKKLAGALGLVGVLGLSVAPPAAAGASTDAALALGAFAVFNQIVRGETILHSIFGPRPAVAVPAPPPVVHAPPAPVVYAPPARVVVQPPPVVYVPPPRVVVAPAPRVVYAPAPVYVVHPGISHKGGSWLKVDHKHSGKHFGKHSGKVRTGRR